MIAVAAIACACAWLEPAATVGVAFAVSSVILPIVKAPASRRLDVALYICLVYPMVFLCSLYLTWFVAWIVLGRCPRAGIDDPGQINPAVSISCAVTIVFLAGLPFAFIFAGLLLLADLYRIVRRARNGATGFVMRLLAGVILWLWLVMVSRLNLLGYGYVDSWFND